VEDRPGGEQGLGGLESVLHGAASRLR
jgi:hypothetical protein